MILRHYQEHSDEVNGSVFPELSSGAIERTVNSDLLARDKLETRHRNLAAQCARVVLKIRPAKGVGNAGCRQAPAASRAKKLKHTSVVTTGPPASPGIPARGWF
jgi:hypothetical protein